MHCLVGGSLSFTRRVLLVLYKEGAPCPLQGGGSLSFTRKISLLEEVLPSPDRFYHSLKSYAEARAHTHYELFCCFLEEPEILVGVLPDLVCRALSLSAVLRPCLPCSVLVCTPSSNIKGPPRSFKSSPSFKRTGPLINSRLEQF